MELTQTKDYLLLIDEEVEIKEGDYYLDGGNNLFTPQHNFFAIKSFNKVIGYYPLTKEAKELDLPLLPNPFEEVDIEKLACKKYDIKESINDYDERYYNSHNVAKAEAFIDGYKAAQSKGQYSLENIKDALNQLADEAEYGISNFAREDIITKIIQSLSTQQLPKEFIPEYEAKTEFGPFKLKTTTNSEGKEEIQGTYKY